MTGLVSCAISSCARCGENHDTPLTFVPFKNPVQDAGGPYTHWALCPVTRDPILWREMLGVVAPVPLVPIAPTVVGEPKPLVTTLNAGLTTDRNDPALHKEKPGGQNEKYLVLSEDERAKGFVRPVRAIYKHVACGFETFMAPGLAETYARDPKFYTATFCAGCGKHFPLIDKEGKPQFHWIDGEGVGT